MRDCPICGDAALQPFLEIEGLPVFCNVLWPSEREALDAPRGDLALVYCRRCSHFFNAAFDPELVQYSAAYENSLHFSDLFNAFARQLAERLVRTYDLHGKDIIDVGCGRGDFLEMLCRLGDNRGVGFDQSNGAEADHPDESVDLRFVNHFLTPDHPRLPVDFVCCRHVLEHIADPLAFLRDLRSWLGTEGEPVLYFEVPNARYTFEDGGIWDLIYEHCSYFTLESLLSLFGRAGLHPQAWGESFGGQYLFVEARVAPYPTTEVGDLGRTDLFTSLWDFPAQYRARVARWCQRIEAAKEDGVGIALWGSGSKGVTFLNLLDPGPVVRAVVDINPHKSGRFVPGTGHQVVSPEDLIPYRPDLVVVTNALYTDEIEAELKRLGIGVPTLPA